MIKKLLIMLSFVFVLLLSGCIDTRDLNADNYDYDYDKTLTEWGKVIGAIHVITDKSFEYKSERFKKKNIEEEIKKIDHSGYVYVLDGEFCIDGYTKTEDEILTYSSNYEVKEDAYVTVIYLYYYSDSNKYDLASFNSAKVQVDCMMSQTIDTNPKFMFERNYRIIGDGNLNE